MSEPITVPAATADRIANYLEQQQQLTSAIQLTINTLAEALLVPQGWQYDPTRRAFVEVQPQGAAAEGSNEPE